MQNQSGLVPLGNAVLVEPLDLPEFKSTVGLIIPESARQRLLMAEQQAVVIEAGPEAWAKESQPRAKPGDTVMIAKYAGHATVGPKDKKQYRVINANDVFLRIET